MTTAFLFRVLPQGKGKRELPGISVRLREPCENLSRGLRVFLRTDMLLPGTGLPAGMHPLRYFLRDGSLAGLPVRLPFIAKLPAVGRIVTLWLGRMLPFAATV